MISESSCSYGFERHLQRATFEEALEEVTAALKQEGFGILTQIGLLLPCNVVVQEASGGGVTVSIADPRAMFSLVNNPRLIPVVDDTDQRLRRVIASLD